jgi:hypothetical protein
LVFPSQLMRLSIRVAAFALMGLLPGAVACLDAEARLQGAAAAPISPTSGARRYSPNTRRADRQALLLFKTARQAAMAAQQLPLGYRSVVRYDVLLLLEGNVVMTPLQLTRLKRVTQALAAEPAGIVVAPTVMGDADRWVVAREARKQASSVTESEADLALSGLGTASQPVGHPACMGCESSALRQEPPMPLASPLSRTMAALSCDDRPICPGGTAKWWAQEAIDADLMKAKAAELAAHQTAKVAVVDSGFDATQAARFQAVGPIRILPGVADGDVHPTAGQRFKALFGAKNPAQKSPAEHPIELGDPGLDEFGHGTMVISVLAGEGRFGSAPNIELSSYRVTETPKSRDDRFFGATTTNAILQMATWRACQENRDASGVAIVNLSWGARLDESGVEPEEQLEATRKLIELFAQEGCLVVKAAGNSSFRREVGSDPDDAYLRVAAIDGSRERAKFSSFGEISAPGASVYVIESSQSFALTDPKNFSDPRGSRSFRCSAEDATPGASKRLINGTSFAAPMASAVASQVVRVLKGSGTFRKLSNPDRVKLLTRILRASELNGSINGYRAVMIADSWNRHGRVSVPTPQELSDILAQAQGAFCASPFQSCDPQAGCAANLVCHRNARERLAVCPTPDTRAAEWMAREAIDRNEVESITRFVRDLRRNPEHSAQASAAQLNSKALESYLKSRAYDFSPSTATARLRNVNTLRAVPFNFFQTIVAPYVSDCARSKKDCNEDLVESILESALSSREIAEHLSRGVDGVTGEDRGSRAAIDAFVSVSKDARTVLGEARVQQIFERFLDGERARYAEALKLAGATSSSARAPSVYFAGMFRLIDQVIASEPENSPLRRAIQSRERAILLQTMQSNPYARLRTQDLTAVAEVFPMRAAHYPMIKRNRDLLDRAVESGSFQSLSPLQVIYLLEHVNEVPEWKAKRQEILWSVLKSVLEQKGWGEVRRLQGGDLQEISGAADLEIFEIVLKQLAEESAPSVADRAELRRLLENGRNAHILSRVTAGYFSKRRVGLDYLSDASRINKATLTYANHPWLSSLGSESFAQALTLAMTRTQDFQAIAALPYESFEAAAHTIRWIAQDPARARSASGRRVLLPTIRSDYSSRLTPADRLPGPLVEQVLPPPLELLDQTLTWALKLQSRELTRSLSDRFFKKLLDPASPEVLTLLRSTAQMQWRTAAQAILDEKARQDAQPGASAAERFRWPKYSEETLRLIRTALKATEVQ